MSHGDFKIQYLTFFVKNSKLLSFKLTDELFEPRLDWIRWTSDLDFSSVRDRQQILSLLEAETFIFYFWKLVYTLITF